MVVCVRPGPRPIAILETGVAGRMGKLIRRQREREYPSLIQSAMTTGVASVLNVLVLSVGVGVDVLPLLPSVGAESLLEPLEGDTAGHGLMNARLSSQIGSTLLLLWLGGSGSRFGGRTKDGIGTGQLVAPLAHKLASTADGRKRVCPRGGRGDDRGGIRSSGRGLSALRLLDPDPESVGLAVPLGGNTRKGKVETGTGSDEMPTSCGEWAP